MRSEEIFDKIEVNITAKTPIARNSVWSPTQHRSFIFNPSRQMKKSEDFTALEKIIIDEEKEEIK